MKKKRVKDKHGVLPYASGSVGELKRCLAPYIPFKVVYHPWLDLIGYNFRSRFGEVINRFNERFGKPKPSKHTHMDGQETFVRSYLVQGVHQVDLETYDVGRFKHGRVKLYDNPPEEVQSEVHLLLAGTGHWLSKLEYGVDLFPMAGLDWAPDTDQHMVVQAINAQKYGCAPELVYLFDLIVRLRWLTYGQVKLDFQYDRAAEVLTAYLNNPRKDPVALKTYIGPGYESDKSKTSFVRIELTANRTAIRRMIQRGAVEEHGVIHPSQFDLGDRLQMREPKYALIHKNLIRKFGLKFKLHLHQTGFSARYDVTDAMCHEQTGLPLDQALLVQMWRELFDSSPPPYLFTKLFPAPPPPIEN